MSDDKRRLARWAGQVADALQQQVGAREWVAERQLERLQAHLNLLVHGGRRLGACRRRGWNLAAASVLQQIVSGIGELECELVATRRTLAKMATEPTSCRRTFDELRQLTDEFEQVDFKRSGGTLLVRTEPIVLEGISLGRFEIRLETNPPQGNALPALRIVALDPNPASADSSVTHPHVRAEQLCAGDATSPIQRAFDEGRLADLFLIVRSVLQTYNEGSPYVALDKWDGIFCFDCGDTIDREQSYGCERCGRDFCDECMSCCRECGAAHCLGCLFTCQFCKQPHCSICELICKQCRQAGCSDCLQEDLCPNCQPQDVEDDHDPESGHEDSASEQAKAGNGGQADGAAAAADPAPATGPALHAGGVGQAAVLLPSR